MAGRMPPLLEEVSATQGSRGSTFRSRSQACLPRPFPGSRERGRFLFDLLVQRLLERPPLADLLEEPFVAAAAAGGGDRLAVDVGPGDRTAPARGEERFVAAAAEGGGDRLAVDVAPEDRTVAAADLGGEAAGGEGAPRRP